MTTPISRWRVDIYYSGYTTLEVDAIDMDDAITKGREEAIQRPGFGGIIDPNGALSQLVNSLEPWGSCDTAEVLG